MGARRNGPDTTRFLQQDIFSGALATLGLATDPLTQNTYSLAGGNPVSHVEWDGHMLIADGGAFAESGGWAQGQLLERIPAENFGKGVLLGP